MNWKQIQAVAFAMAMSVSGLAFGGDEAVKPFNGKDTAGWKSRDEKALANWKVVGDAKMDEKNNKALLAVGEAKADSAILLLDRPVHGADLFTEQSFGDCEVHVEFMVPKGSNSGVYLMGQYEIQVLDSFGKKDDALKPGDVGGVYNTKAPTKNAAKAPGEWQSFDIVFKAPRFDAAGKKTANAMFVSVKLNGVTIHENVEAKAPTGGQLPGGEKPTGPLMFQGDHGPVAYRNVVVKASK